MKNYHLKHFQSEQYKVAEKLTTGEIKELIAHRNIVNGKRNFVRRECIWAVIMYQFPSTKLGIGERRFSWLWRII